MNFVYKDTVVFLHVNINPRVISKILNISYIDLIQIVFQYNGNVHKNFIEFNTIEDFKEFEEKMQPYLIMKKMEEK